MSIAHLAEWIRWTGVAVAVAGVLIATRDGVREIWRHIREPSWLRGLLSHLSFPFNSYASRTARARPGSARVAAGDLWPTTTRPWEPDADDHRKIELLHIQHDLLQDDASRFRQEMFARLASIRAEISAADERLSKAHRELRMAVREKDRRAAQIDARGLWPIGFGILLTGIPAELAHFAAVGIAVAVIAVVITLSLAWAGMAARAATASE